MRRILWIAATAAIFAFPATALCQQPDQQQGEHAAQPPPPTALEEKKEAPKAAPAAAQGQSQSQSQSPAATSIPPNPPKESLAEAARRSREQRKDAGKSGRVFTNDNLPAQGVSTVGVEAPAGGDAAAISAVAAEGAPPNDEKTWRERFGKLRDKLAKDQAELDVLQREMGVVNIQAYNDPVKALQQNLTRSDINAKAAKIDAMTKQIEADKQAISDAEDQLRKSGGDVGWAR
jgi:hypothetical protein